MKLDFVIITFSRDFNLLKLQARSFYRYVPYDLIESIIIICKDDQIHVDRIAEIKPEFGYLQDKVKIYNADIICNNWRDYYHGWFAQQIIKLRVYKVCTAKYHIIFDTKNHFIRNIDDTYFFKNNKPLQVIENYTNSIMKEYIINTFNYFQKLKNPSIAFENYYKDCTSIPHFQTLLTPVIFITDICKEIDTKYNICDIINDKENTAEFALYGCYLIYNNLQNLYETTYKQFSLTIYNLNDFNNLNNLHEYSILGISADLFSKINDSIYEKTLLKEIWLSYNLCNKDESEKIITYMSYVTAKSWSILIF